MIIEIQHETRLEYSEPASEALTEVRMEPITDAEQSLHSFHLAVNPKSEVFRYQDGFGNRVHHFNVLAAHESVRVLAASIVETARPRHDLSASRAVFPISEDQLAMDALDFL